MGLEGLALPLTQAWPPQVELLNTITWPANLSGGADDPLSLTYTAAS
jgi:hypothetical protein